MTREVGQGSGSSKRMGGYDQFSSLPFYVLQIIYVVHLYYFVCSHEFIQYVLSYHIMTFMMPVHASNIPYLFVLILQSCCLCCYLFIFSCSVMMHVPCLYAYYIYMIHMFYVLMFHLVMDIFDIMISMINHLLYVITIMLIYGIKMIWKMSIFLTFQKPNVRHFSVRGFAVVLKPDPFNSKNFLIWKAKMELWLTAMSCYHAAQGKPANLPPEDEAKFKADDNLFRGAVISALDTKFQKSYIILPTGKELWDALVGKFGVTDAGSELYLMEQLYDYKMVENRSVVEQAHEFQALAKELELFPCPLPDKFVAGGIIAKLPPSWKDFATSLNHKRQEFNVEELIGTLDVEERARTKDNGKDVETSTANVVQKRNFCKFNKKKNQNKQENTNKPIQTAQFKKKNNNNNKGKGGCFVCGSDQHWARECPDRKFTHDKKSANVVTTETRDGTSRYGNSLPFVLSVCNSHEWWMDSGANINVCADVSMFSSYQVGRSGALLMGNGSHAHVLGVGTIILKFTLGKTVPLKSVQHVPSIKKNLVSASILCRDGYKVVLESNKCVVSKHGTFVGKGYDCGGLFRLSLYDVCNKMVNSVNISDESDLWHSRFCHASFGCLMQLANLNLIPKFNLVKKSK
jgi:hypothetical protein